MTDFHRRRRRRNPDRCHFGTKVPPIKSARRRRGGNRSWFRVLLIALPLAVASAVFVFDGPPSTNALPLSVVKALWGEPPVDRERATFSKCDGAGWNCVVDGDTIRYRGEKIRIADINTPETYEAQCASEKALGDRATARMIVLLNEGPFTLEPVDRDQDQYGRSLRTITRGGESLGAVLVAEGLAEEWKGYRSGWC